MAMKRVRRGVDRSHAHAEFERPMSVASTRTTADVLWQDGTRQRGVASASLLPFVTRNVHDFLPGQHVVRARGGDGSAAAGVVRGLSCRDRTVSVLWLKQAAAMPNSGDEILSAYDLAIDGNFNVFYGNVVVRLPHGDSSGGSSMHEAVVPPAQSNDDLSWVGHVSDLCEDGHVLVKWGNDKTTKVITKLIKASLNYPRDTNSRIPIDGLALKKLLH